MTEHPCGHATRTEGCGGCDPAAIEYVIDDGTHTLRRFDPTSDTPTTPPLTTRPC